MANRKTVMVVDDEPDVLAYLTAVLEDNGYEAASAANGIEAYESACFDPPDLITLDITMPGQSGLQTYRDMKNEPTLAKVPIIIITATVDSLERFTDMLNGLPPPDGFFNKPIQTESLLSKIGDLLGDPQEADCA